MSIKIYAMILSIILVAVILMTIPVHAQEADATPRGEAENVTKDDIISWANEGENITTEKADAAYSYFLERQSEFSAEDREQLRTYLTEQISGSESEERDVEEDSSDDSDTDADAEGDARLGVDKEEETGTYDDALAAIEDNQIQASELPEEFEYSGKRVFEGLRVEYWEWEGDHTTLILKSDKNMTITINDAYVASNDVDRAAPLYSVELEKGLNVIQINTEANSQGNEYLSVSNNEYINTLSNPYQPFIERTSKRHIPISVAGGILGFSTLFVLFASYRKGKYKGKFIHLGDIL